jgi:hypothetical protein
MRPCTATWPPRPALELPRGYPARARAAPRRQAQAGTAWPAGAHSRRWQDRLRRRPAQRHPCAPAGNQPNAYVGVRNLVTGAFRRAEYAKIAHARCYYGRDDQCILALYGYS